MICTVDGNLKF